MLLGQTLFDPARSIRTIIVSKGPVHPSERAGSVGRATTTDVVLTTNYSDLLRSKTKRAISTRLAKPFFVSMWLM